MDDLKELYKQAGLVGTGVTFIFTDNEIKEETFLESINNILSSGEIANLFAKDELDEIQSALIPVMKKVSPRRPPTVDNLYDFFITRARSNLHVVLGFSPVSNNKFQCFQLETVTLRRSFELFCLLHNIYILLNVQSSTGQLIV